LASYEGDQALWAAGTLGPRVTKAALQLGNILNGVLEGLSREWVRAGLDWPNGSLRVESLVNVAGLTHLPNDRLEDRGHKGNDSQTHGVRCANRILDLARRWPTNATLRVDGLEEQHRFMANYCTEVIARRLEARVHNLRSTYDTWVAGTQEESECPHFRVVRSTVSETLAFLEMVTALTHLYERHDVYERNGESRELFESLVSLEDLLDLTINSGIRLAHRCLERTVPVAESILDAFSVKQTVVLKVAEEYAMHARPLSLIVGIVQKHGTPSEMRVSGQSCSAASMMQMLVLIGTFPDEKDFEFVGDPSTLHDLKLLFAHNLGEDGLDALPEGLAYLRT
jgi:phosphotransferase system HPr-like phosphotransfer protein